jgi:GNAT superfamily N-acetyltransferase
MISHRPASREELDTAVEWASAEGWNPGLADAEAFWSTDPEGFVCVECNGETIATGSIVNYGGQFGFMGFFIVRPDLRGKGIGRDFWIWRRDLLLSRLQPGAAIGMDGVFTMQPFYARGGFVFSHRNLRMAGTGEDSSPQPGLVRLSDVPFDSVANYDRKHFGFDRREFLRHWIAPSGGLGLAAVQEGAVVAMGVVRPCREGFKIGPLFADSSILAESVFRGLSAHAAGAALFLDAPENNPEAMSLAERHGLTEVFGCARMYHGPAPQLPWKNIYGITTFELG